MHDMDNTKRVITIIGLVFEAIGFASLFIVMWFLNNLMSIPDVAADLEAMSAEEYEFFMYWMNVLENIVNIGVFVMGAFLLLNLYLFIKLMSGKFDDRQAKKVYLYQAIYGGVNLLSNQIVGVLYLISGVGGYNGHKEEKDIRSGI